MIKAMNGDTNTTAKVLQTLAKDPLQENPIDMLLACGLTHELAYTIGKKYPQPVGAKDDQEENANT